MSVTSVFFSVFNHTYQMALRDLVLFCLLEMSEVLLITLCFLFVDRLDDLDADLRGKRALYTNFVYFVN